MHGSSPLCPGFVDCYPIKAKPFLSNADFGVVRLSEGFSNINSLVVSIFGFVAERVGAPSSLTALVDVMMVEKEKWK